MKRVAVRNVPSPYSRPLEQFVIPQVGGLMVAVSGLMNAAQAALWSDRLIGRPVTGLWMVSTIAVIMASPRGPVQFAQPTLQRAKVHSCEVGVVRPLQPVGHAAVQADLDFAQERAGGDQPEGLEFAVDHPFFQPLGQFTGEPVQHLAARARVLFEVNDCAAVVMASMALSFAFEFAVLEASLGKVYGLQRHQRIARTGTTEEAGQGPVRDQNPLLFHDDGFQFKDNQSSAVKVTVR